MHTADLFVFIGATQAERWARLVDSAYGGDPNRAQSGFVQRLASDLALFVNGIAVAVAEIKNPCR